MEIVLIFIGSIVIFLIIINYLRKLHLDAIHFNFLELVDVIGGQVLRRGFLSRPVYHGEFNGTGITINFSSERSQKKRREYLNISIAKKLNNNLTISTEDWIKNRNEGSLTDFKPLDIAGDVHYVIRKPSKVSYLKKNHRDDFVDYIRKLTPFTYIYCGQNGVLFERECDNIAICTKHPQLKENIELIFNLTQVFQ